MGLKLSGIIGLKRPSRLTLSGALTRRLGFEHRHRVQIAFGVAGAWCYVETDSALKPGELGLSEHLIDSLLLPTDLPLEVEFEGQTLRFGPFVGMLLNKKSTYLSKGMRTTPATYTTHRLGTTTYHTPIGLFGYVERFEDFGGIVAFFGLDSLNPQDRTCEAWVYDPGTEGFVHRRLPWPRAIYRKAGLPETWKATLGSIIGDGLYNNYFADKWEVVCWLREDEDLQDRVPETVLYRGIGDLMEMVKTHGTVYAKPVDGLGGYGVIQVRQEGEAVAFAYRHEGVNTELLAQGAEEARAIFEGIRGRRIYLVQRGLDLVHHDGGVVDIRVLCQKDQRGRWQGVGIVIRQGASGAVVSNISSDGIAFTMDELFDERFGWSVPEVRHMEARLYALSRRVCQRLEEAGCHLGYCGVDVGLTKDKQLFIIEVNLRDPDSTIALDVNDTELYHRLKVGPLVYGKGLDGFKGPGESL